IGLQFAEQLDDAGRDAQHNEDRLQKRRAQPFVEEVPDDEADQDAARQQECETEIFAELPIGIVGLRHALCARAAPAPGPRSLSRESPSWGAMARSPG